jgi:antitoxin ParD1/3/4
LTKPKETKPINVCLKNTIQNLLKLPIFGNFRKILQMKNTSISLGNYFDQFVQSQVSVGRYKNVSEVIRAGLRLLEDEENKMKALRNAIQEGLNSAIVENFDFEENLKSLKAEKRKNG